MTSASDSRQICVRCIMDTSDPDIRFDAQGICSHCRSYEAARGRYFFEKDDGRSRLASMITEIKARGKGRAYDCILGLSGGVDSSYVAHWAITEGLRPLAVHVDAGWNSEVAVGNIERIVKKLNLDLVTHVVRWEEMRDLQIAFLKSGVPNQDTPQDHAYFAFLYQNVLKHGIRDVLTGANYSTESILPSAWGYTALDGKWLRAIHRRHGAGRLAEYRSVSLWRYHVLYPRFYRIRTLFPLNYLDYRKSEAEALLGKIYGWRPYGVKHGESRFTRFFQNYFLPARFGYDKRRAHLSSLVVSGQINRSEALMEMNNPAYSPRDFEDDRDYILKKLGLTHAEFEVFLKAPLRTHRDYPNDEALWKRLLALRSWLMKRGWA